MKIAAYEVRPDEKPVIENLCTLVGLNLERLDGKDAVIDIETTVGHRNSRIEVTVALCSTCGCVAQDQFG